jgi:hypothetical protein
MLPAYQDPDSETFVDILDNDGEWFVRIVEDGRQTQLLSFEVEASARAYADGQTMRLKMVALPTAERPASTPGDCSAR